MTHVMTQAAPQSLEEHVVRQPSEDVNADRHDCLFCGAYIYTECARCGEPIMSTTPGQSAFNRRAEVCYVCELVLDGFLPEDTTCHTY